jgi:hypothetical protein
MVAVGGQRASPCGEFIRAKLGDGALSEVGHKLLVLALERSTHGLVCLLPPAALDLPKRLGADGRAGEQAPVSPCEKTAISDALLQTLRGPSHYRFSFRASGRNWRRPCARAWRDLY